MIVNFDFSTLQWKIQLLGNSIGLNNVLPTIKLFLGLFIAYLTLNLKTSTCVGKLSRNSTNSGQIFTFFSKTVSKGFGKADVFLTASNFWANLEFLLFRGRNKSSFRKTDLPLSVFLFDCKLNSETSAAGSFRVAGEIL